MWVWVNTHGSFPLGFLRRRRCSSSAAGSTDAARAAELACLGWWSLGTAARRAIEPARARGCCCSRSSCSASSDAVPRHRGVAAARLDSVVASGSSSSRLCSPSLLLARRPLAGGRACRWSCSPAWRSCRPATSPSPASSCSRAWPRRGRPRRGRRATPLAGRASGSSRWPWSPAACSASSAPTGTSTCSDYPVRLRDVDCVGGAARRRRPGGRPRLRRQLPRARLRARAGRSSTTTVRHVPRRRDRRLRGAGPRGRLQAVLDRRSTPRDGPLGHRYGCPATGSTTRISAGVAPPGRRAGSLAVPARGSAPRGDPIRDAVIRR